MTNNKSLHPKYPFLTAISGENHQDLFLWMQSDQRIHKYVFYEFISSPKIICEVENQPFFHPFLQKAILWHMNYLSLFLQEGLENKNIMDLAGKWGWSKMTWNEYREDKFSFFKGLSWHKIL